MSRKISFKVLFTVMACLILALGLSTISVSAAKEEMYLNVSGQGEYLYDGTEHGFVIDTLEKAKVEYSVKSGDEWGDWTTTAPKIKNAGELIVKIKASKPGLETLEIQETIKIRKRNITLESSSLLSEYKGTPITSSSVRVGGDGLADGEKINTTVTGSQTNAGSSPNTFTYEAAQGTDLSNYNITTVEGTLTVEKRFIIIKSYNKCSVGSDSVSVSSIKIETGEFVDGDLEEGYPKVTGSLTGIGEAINTIEYKWTSPEKADNYDIIENLGTLKNVEKTDGWCVIANDSKHLYDGKPKTVFFSTAEVDRKVLYFQYSTDYTDETKWSGWSSLVPSFKDAGTYYYQIKYNDYVTDVKKLTILPRNITLKSATLTKKYDGAPLTTPITTPLEGYPVSVTGDGLVGTDEINYNVTGSQTEAGTSKNTFTYSAAGDTKLSNYNITKVEGDLTVTKLTGLEFVVYGTEEKYGTRSFTKRYNGDSLKTTTLGLTITDGTTVSRSMDGGQTWIDMTTSTNYVNNTSVVGCDTVIYKAEKPNYETAYATIERNFLPKIISVSGTSTDDFKTYDGTLDVNVDAGILIGVVGTDDVKLSATAELADANVGTEKQVTIEYKLSGNKASYYELEVSKDTTTFLCTVTKRALSDCTIDKIDDQLCTGSAVKPELTITYGDMELVKDTDYTVAYSNNVLEGTATVTINGIGNYTGTKSTTFKLIRYDLKDATIDTIADQGYTGSPITPALTVKYDGKTLVKNKDYAVGYYFNTDKGTASVTIAGVGGYKGSKSTTFKIVEADFDVKFDMQGHGTAVDTQKVKDGELASEPTKPSEDGYLFVGWFEETSFNNKWDFSTPVTGNIILYAQWVKVDKKVTVGDINVNVDEDAFDEILSKYTGCATMIGAEIIISQNSISNSDMSAIETANPNKYYEYYDVKLMFTEENDTFDYGDYNNTLIPITYEFDFTGKSNIQTFRVHGGSVDELTETPNADGEFVKYDKTKGTVTVKAKKYSTYGFVYDKVPSTGDNSSIWLYVILLVVSISLATVLVLKKRSN